MPHALYEVSPRYLAASPLSDHRDHLDALAASTGWTLTAKGSTATVTSPCERIVLRHDTAAEGWGPHLVITARTGPGAPARWRADIAGNTPVELVTALTSTITTALETDPDHLVYDIAATPEPMIMLEASDEHWEFVSDQGLGGFQATDGLAAVLSRAPDSPEPPLRNDPDVAWHLAAVHPAGSLWDVSFTQGVPVFVVASALEQTLSPEPLIRPAGIALHPAFAPLITARPLPATRPARTATGLPPQSPGPAPGNAKTR
ncbi:hypothetical protein GCM10010232_50060 [Streptomyces amakusaensis]|uniref:DUF317 domain-containing protein n=1 Tax=Streptomyces amakusaensis TaxID=67271 RepID=A0ABW0AK05_9ACTN